MKKISVMKRVIVMALVILMTGATTAFAAATAQDYESDHITVTAGSTSYDVYSILYEDSTNRYRASAWAVVDTHTNVPAKYIGVDAWLCTPRDQILASTGLQYNSTAATFQYACTTKQYAYQMVYAAGEIDVYTGTKHIYEDVPESPYVGGESARALGLAEETSFPVNQNGDTYGTVRTAKIVGYKPDLIAAVGNGGIEGYIRIEDMRPNITCDADIEAYYEKLDTDPDIPLYNLNGTVIGSFTIGISEEFAPDAASEEDVKAAILADMENVDPEQETMDQVKLRLANMNGDGAAVYHAPTENETEIMREELIDGSYPVANGLTYGTMKQAGIVGEPPDLVSVIATNGKHGWVTLKDFSPVRYLAKSGASTEEINACIDASLNDNAQKYIPVYDLDMKIIGEFPTGRSER